jgi:DNA-binding CsgD family transcriptional regulator
MPDSDDAAALLSEARDHARRSGAGILQAHATVAEGALRRRQGRRSAAREELREGLDLATRCGAHALAARAREELGASGARMWREAISGPASLTPSERRIARMAAAGESNRSIARALFVTEKTVESHLTAAYAKLGIRSRRELADSLGVA